MEFGEIVTVIALFVILPAIIMRGVRDIKTAKHAARASGGELRASELRTLVREAVEEAVAPLAQRVSDLEDRLGDEPVAHLRARLDSTLLADAVEDDVALGDSDGWVPADRRRTA